MYKDGSLLGGRLVTCLVKFVKGQRSKVNEICENLPKIDLLHNKSKSKDAILIKHGTKIDYYLGIDW